MSFGSEMSHCDNAVGLVGDSETIVLPWVEVFHLHYPTACWNVETPSRLSRNRDRGVDIVPGVCHGGFAIVFRQRYDGSAGMFAVGFRSDIVVIDHTFRCRGIGVVVDVIK